MNPLTLIISDDYGWWHKLPTHRYMFSVISVIHHPPFNRYLHLFKISIGLFFPLYVTRSIIEARYSRLEEWNSTNIVRGKGFIPLMTKIRTIPLPSLPSHSTLSIKEVTLFVWKKKKEKKDREVEGGDKKRFLPCNCKGLFNDGVSVPVFFYVSVWRGWMCRVSLVDCASFVSEFGNLGPDPDCDWTRRWAVTGW